MADDVHANAAVGISMGAGALCAGLAAEPDRFEAVVLALPASLDRPRVAMQEFTALARLVQAADSEAVTAHLLAMEPQELADLPEVQRWCAEQAARLLAGSAGAALEALPHQVPVADASSLAAVTAPVLVIAQTDDAIHPVSVAEELAEVLPQARLEVFGAGGILWAHRERVTTVVGDFIAEHTT